eukprot:1158443-Pelagomonas_calceolata.AAC.10
MTEDVVCMTYKANQSFEGPGLGPCWSITVGKMCPEDKLFQTGRTATSILLPALLVLLLFLLVLLQVPFSSAMRLPWAAAWDSTKLPAGHYDSEQGGSADPAGGTWTETAQDKIEALNKEAAQIQQEAHESINKAHEQVRFDCILIQGAQGIGSAKALGPQHACIGAVRASMTLMGSFTVISARLKERALHGWECKWVRKALETSACSKAQAMHGWECKWVRKALVLAQRRRQCMAGNASGPARHWVLLTIMAVIDFSISRTWTVMYHYRAYPLRPPLHRGSRRLSQGLTRKDEKSHACMLQPHVKARKDMRSIWDTCLCFSSN